MQAKASSVSPRRRRRREELFQEGTTKRPPREPTGAKPPKRAEAKPKPTAPKRDPAAERAARAAEVGATVEELDDLRDWVLSQADSDFRPIPPDAANHAALKMMLWVPAALGLRPCEVESSTGLCHQHQRKLRPAADGEGEVHVTVHTVVRWSNGFRLNPLRMLAEAYRRFLALLISTVLC